MSSQSETSFALHCLMSRLVPWLFGEKMLPGHGEYLAILFKGVLGGEESAAALRGLDHQSTQRHAAHYAIPAGEVLGVGLRSKRVFGDERPVLGYLGRELGVFPGIDDVRAVAEHGDGALAGVERGPMRYSVGCLEPSRLRWLHRAPRQVVGEPVRGFTLIGRSPPCAHHRHRALVFRQEVATHVENRGKVVDFLQPGRIVGVVPSDRPDAVVVKSFQFDVRVYGRPASGYLLQCPFVQARVFQFGAAGPPGILQGAESVQKQ